MYKKDTQTHMASTPACSHSRVSKVIPYSKANSSSWMGRGSGWAGGHKANFHENE